MVLLIAMKQVDLGAAITDAIVPAVGGFILGYYSDRARDYLDRLRDKLFSDPSPPVVEISLPDDCSTSLSPKAVVRGQVTGGEVAAATLKVNGEARPLAVDGHGNFSGLVTLVQGVNVIQVEVETAAKRAGSASRIVTYLGKPVVVIQAPKEGERVATETVTVRGTVKDEWGVPRPGLSAQVVVNDLAPITVKADEKGEFSHEVSGLKAGTNLIRFVVTGDGIVEGKAVTVQVKPPQAPTPTPTPGTSVAPLPVEVRPAGSPG
jgi:hypothetical protein